MSIIIFGDFDGDLSGRARADGQFLDLPAFYATSTFGYGDVTGSILDRAVGGNDLIRGSDGTGFTTFVWGDSSVIEDRGRGGNDMIFGGSTPPNTGYIGQFICGDADEFIDNAWGGNDLIVSGVSEFYIAGDANQMYDKSRGGDDVLILCELAVGEAAGDARAMHDKARGGNDMILIHGSHKVVAGDALSMFDKSRGGDDLLVAKDGSEMFGDAQKLFDKARGGNDTLVGGDNTDQMWGDGNLFGKAIGGADTFVLKPGGGEDEIMDFRQEDRDLIDVRGYGFTCIRDPRLDISMTGSDTLVMFNDKDSVTLVGFTDTLTEEDFIF